MTPLQRMEGLQVVNARLEARPRRRATALILSVLGTAAMATGAIVVIRSGNHLGVSDGDTLGYRIEGGEVGDGGYIRSFSPAGSLLHFEEGTELRLMARARGRLTSVDEQGARFAIEEGEAEVKVTPRPKARWLVDAGPFLITVRGTVFTAAWNGATERLDIRMKKGLVSVTGPLANGVMSVRAGQHLSVNVRSKEVLLREMAREPDAAAPAGAGDVYPGVMPPETNRGGSSRGPAAAVAAAATARGTGTTSARSWSAALAAGDLESILTDAESRGLRRSLAGAGSEDLAALADAARYLRRDDVARQALMTARERFPRSARARDSAFLLGRLEEARTDGGERALQWYDSYLRESPSGAYSSEALGRKMTATERLRGIPAARQVADEYLRRFPNGTYAGAARALRDAP
ncbi:MAG: FecR domain-containing protein [Bacteroidota bacterium]